MLTCSYQLNVLRSLTEFHCIHKQVAQLCDVCVCCVQDDRPILLTPALKGFSMVTQYLLENGANPNISDKVSHGGSCDNIAAKRGVGRWKWGGGGFRYLWQICEDQ